MAETYIKLSDHLAEIAEKDKEIARLKSGSVRDAAFLFPLTKKGCMRFAIGFYTDVAVLADAKTVIVNDGSFAAFNSRLSQKEMQEVVDNQDETGRTVERWAKK